MNDVFSILTIIAAVVGVLGPVGAVVAMIAAPTVAGPAIAAIVQRFMECKLCVIVVAILLGALVAYWIGRNGAYQHGVTDTINGIARADGKLIDRALTARKKLKECQAEGRRWSQSTGECR